MRAEVDADEVYENIMEAIRKGDSRAMKLWVETVIGKADVMKASGEKDLMSMVVEKLLQHTDKREIVIDINANP